MKQLNEYAIWILLGIVLVTLSIMSHFPGYLTILLIVFLAIIIPGKNLWKHLYNKFKLWLMKRKYDPEKDGFEALPRDQAYHVYQQMLDKEIEKSKELKSEE